MQELFSAFGIDWKLLLAQVLNFGIVLAALSYFLYRPVLNTLEKRRGVLAKGVEDAERAGQMLAGADAEAASRVVVAETEAGEIVSRARQAAGAEKAATLEEARVRAEHMYREAAARAAEEAARALRGGEREIARLAMLAAEKVLAHKS